MAPRIAVMHHRRSVFAMELYEQVGGTADLLWVLSSPERNGLTEPRLLNRLGTVVDIAGMSPDQAAETLGAHGPDGIVSFVDEHIEDAAALAQRLGLRYHTPEVALSVVDKRIQRTLAADAGIPCPEFRVVPPGASKEQVGQLATEVGFPVVLKPGRGSGSRGIQQAGSYEDLLSLLASAEGGRFDGVVEELLPDDPTRDPTFASYVSVESVVSHGMVSHVAVTGRFPLASAFRETGNFIPAAEDDCTLDALTTMAGRDHRGARHPGLGGAHRDQIDARRPEVDRGQRPLGWSAAVRAPRGVSGQPLPGGLRGGGGCSRLLRQDGGVRRRGFPAHVPAAARRARRVASIDGLASVEEVPGVGHVVVSRSIGDAIDASEGTDSKVLTVQGRTADIAGLASTLASIESFVTIGYD